MGLAIYLFLVSRFRMTRNDGFAQSFALYDYVREYYGTYDKTHSKTAITFNVFDSSSVRTISVYSELIDNGFKIID